MNIIQQKLSTYKISTLLDEENAIKEIYQELALKGLSDAGFFHVAAFQGGTCLRIVHGLNRFSEDLDFILDKSSTNLFSWERFLPIVQQAFENYDIHLEIKSADRQDRAIQRAILKDSSFIQVFELTNKRRVSDRQTIKIKMELDVNPPENSNFERAYLAFPSPFSIKVQDMPSLFASKCHAILCRPFLKGRDWFDFLWYMARGVKLNLKHLESALKQTGHWKKLEINELDYKTLSQALLKRISSIDWDDAKRDVLPLVNMEERKGLQNWCSDLFKHYTNKLELY